MQLTAKNIVSLFLRVDNKLHPRHLIVFIRFNLQVLPPDHQEHIQLGWAITESHQSDGFPRISGLTYLDHTFLQPARQLFP